LSDQNGAKRSFGQAISHKQLLGDVRESGAERKTRVQRLTAAGKRTH